VEKGLSHTDAYAHTYINKLIIIMSY